MKFLLSTLVLAAIFIVVRFMDFPRDSRDAFLSSSLIPITLSISGYSTTLRIVPGLTVGEGLRQAQFAVKENDLLYPPIDAPLLVGTLVTWQPARSVRILADKETRALETTAVTAEDIIRDAGLTLDEDDLVTPSLETTLPNGSEIVITRVEIREEVKEKKLPYVTKAEDDDELSWRKKIVTQKGENGIEQTVYKVSYHNGKEVNRKRLSTKITKEPVTEVVTQGTHVKTGKAHRGGASWYAWTGTMAAANPWLPKGSYVKVTNTENGKSVIVIINDRGPFVPGRIIDLDKVAFEKIASVGAGVINVKMEEITN